MIRRLAVIASTGAAAVALVWALSAPAAPTKTLSGAVGPGQTITLKFNGRAAKNLARGTYRITVRDRSPGPHNFVLTGPGVSNRTITGLAFSGTRSITVALRRGTYTFYCRPHRQFGMVGTFKV
ncbi:MAG: plastocyanin/azurin family copper-binding protein, partial [Gaiellales bacterium]